MKISDALKTVRKTRNFFLLGLIWNLDKKIGSKCFRKKSRILGSLGSGNYPGSCSRGNCPLTSTSANYLFGNTMAVVAHQGRKRMQVSSDNNINCNITSCSMPLRWHHDKLSPSCPYQTHPDSSSNALFQVSASMRQSGVPSEFGNAKGMAGRASAGIKFYDCFTSSIQPGCQADFTKSLSYPLWIESLMLALLLSETIAKALWWMLFNWRIGNSLTKHFFGVFATVFMIYILWFV